MCSLCFLTSRLLRCVILRFSRTHITHTWPYTYTHRPHRPQVVRGHYLTYYKTEAEQTQGKPPQASIDLNGLQSSTAGKAGEFELVGEFGVYQLKADNPEMGQLWLEAVKRHSTVEAGGE